MGGVRGRGVLIFFLYFGNHFCTKNIQKCLNEWRRYIYHFLMLWFQKILWIQSVLGLLAGGHES